MFDSTVTSAQKDGISSIFDKKFDEAYNMTLEAGDLPEVKWARMDYMNVTRFASHRQFVGLLLTLSLGSPPNGMFGGNGLIRRRRIDTLTLFQGVLCSSFFPTEDRRSASTMPSSFVPPPSS